jgi:hypothetical protein
MVMRVSRPLRRSAFVAGILVLLAQACASPAPPSGTPTPTVDVSAWTISTVHLYDGSEDGVQRSFSHPTDWTVRLPEANFDEGHSAIVLYLSNQPLHSTCQRQGTLNLLQCGGEPLERLDSGGVFVEWWIGRGMGWNPPPKPDRRLTIGRRKAVIVLRSSCNPIIGVERSMRVLIERNASSGDVLDGCFRGPATDEAMAQFLAMVEAMF